MKQDSSKMLFGWRVRSALPLPDLADWVGVDGGAAGLQILIDRTLASPSDRTGGWSALGPTTEQGPGAYLGAEGQLFLRIPGVASYLVEGGSRMTVNPELPEDAPELRTFLLGSCLAALCFQRGVVPLHASGVEIGGGAVLMAGDSGLGKSSLAAALMQQGARLLSDDLCVLDLREPEGPLIRPAFPRLRLCDDTARALGIRGAEAVPGRGPQDKHHIPVSAEAFTVQPLPLRLLAVLGRSASPGPVRVTRLSGVLAMRQRHVIHRLELGEAMGCGPLIFKSLAALAATEKMVELIRPDDLEELPALLRTIRSLAG